MKQNWGKEQAPFSARNIPRTAYAAMLLPLLATTAQGAAQGVTYAYDAQSLASINISSSTARISTGHESRRGITLALASGVHKERYEFYGGPPGLQNAIINDVALRDVTGDGILDIIVADSEALTVVYIGLAPGDISFTTTRIDTGSYGALSLGDLDGDGDIDIATSKKNANDDYIPLLYRNNGRGGFRANFESFTTPVNDLITADMNDDGLIDLVLVTQVGLRILSNRGSGKFGLWFSVSGFVGYKAVTSGDMDGDGRTDIILGGTALKVFRNTGRGFRKLKETFSRDGAVSSVAVGDVDNDGSLDILAGADDTYNTLYLQNASGSFDVKTEIGIVRSTMDVQI